MKKETLLKSLNNVMLEQIHAYQSAKTHLRYSIESAIISLMEADNVTIIEFIGDNQISIDLDTAITAVLKLKDDDGDDFISFEVSFENDKGDLESEVRRIYRFDNNVMIDVWEMLIAMNEIGE